MGDIYITDDCPEELVPSACGNQRVPFVSELGCVSVHFEGIDDVTINQGVGIDLEEGVAAYDGNGDSVPFTVSPATIDKCEVGEHVVTYSAVGEGLSMLPAIACRRRSVLHTPSVCRDGDTTIEERVITIEQADPPTIEDTSPVIIPTETDFDPMDNIIGTDDNGNPVEVHYSGIYSDSAEGDIATFNTDLAEPLISVQTSMHPIQDCEPWISPDADTVPYLLRKSPSLGNVYSREYDTVVGASVAWNQLAYSYSMTAGTVTESDGIVTITPSAAGNRYRANGNGVNGIGVVLNHIYLQSVVIKSDGSHQVGFQNFANPGALNCLNKTNSANWTTLSQVAKATASGICYVQLIGETDFDYQIKKNSFVLSDLTLLFGSTIADYIYTLEQGTARAGVAWLRNHGFLTKPYYAYNAGGLEHVSVSAHKTVGFNAWDEEWEEGSIDYQTGQNISSTAYGRAKNYNPCLPNTSYHFTCSASQNVSVMIWYDADKNYLGFTSDGNTRNKTFISPTSASYFRFYFNKSYYNHDICINLTKPTGTPKNGDYVPYAANSYPLDSTLTLRGIPKLNASNQLYYDGDRYESDGTVTRRYGIVDLGTLTWYYSSANQYFYTEDLSSVVKKPASNADTPNIICCKYITSSRNGLDNNCIAVVSTNGNVMIKDSTYSDTTTFKTAVSGVYLVYELATPTTEQADPYTSPQTVDPDGTEEYVDYGVSQGTRDVAIPVGHNTRYMLECPISGWEEVNVWSDPVYGGTIKWNQLIINGNFENTNSWGTASGVSFSVSDNVGKLTIDNNSGTGRANLYQTNVTAINPIIGHKYLITFDYKLICHTNSSLSVLFGNIHNIASYATLGAWTSVKTIRAVTATTYGSTFFLYLSAYLSDYAVGDTIEYRNVMLVDLTEMFGDTLADYIYSLEQNEAGAGVAWFKNLFPDDYYAYDNSYTETTVSAVNGDPYEHYTWQSDLGTIYGGYIDFVNGLVVMTHGIECSGDLTWTLRTTGSVNKLYSANLSKAYLAKPSDVDWHVDNLPYIGASSAASLIPNIDSRAVGVYSYNNAGAEDYAIYAVLPVDISIDDARFCVVYELATPEIYHFNQTEIDAFLGQNNIWSDTNGTTLVKFLKSLPEDEVIQYSAEGVYPIVYEAEDECGNRAEVIRPIIVTDEVNTKYTILFEDGTMIFNVPVDGLADYVAEHGYALYVYPPLDENHDYAFNMYGYKTDAYWWYQKDKIVHVESAEYIQPTSMAYWFYACWSLEDIDFTNIDTSQCTSMQATFAGCTVQTLDLSTFDTRNVTNMNAMFESCGRLTVLDVSNFDTSNVTNMKGMFGYCPLLVVLDLSAFDTSNVTDMNGMFQHCVALRQVDVSSFDTGNVTQLSSMFLDCPSLEELWLPLFDSSSLTHVGQMFQGCTALTTIYTTSAFDLADATYGTTVFSNCTSLVGGNGTVYDSNHRGKDYGHIDTAGNPGYFTGLPQ